MNEYGKKIGNAIRGVRTMHTDTSRLLQDCDGIIGKGKTSIYGNYATRDLTYHVRTTQWMAESVYRLYDCGEDEQGLVEGVTVYFFDAKSRFEEPLLIVGQVKYHVEKDASVKSVSKEWDLWNAFFTWSQKQTLDEVLSPTSSEGGRIEWLKVIAVPLYAVQKMDYVLELIERVRKHKLS